MKIKDVVSIVTPPAKIPSWQYLPSGLYPIIDQGQDYIVGYTNDANKTMSGSYILFGDHTCTIKMSPQVFAQGADGLKILKCKSKVNANYVYYAIKALNYNDGKYRRHWSSFKELSIPTRQINDQDLISAPLSLIDQLIKVNNGMVSVANKLISTIYDYWFVQFDFPDENGRPYKSSGGKMVYNDQLKKEIPEGWKVIKYSDIAKTVTGKHDANFATTDGNYAYFTCSADVLQCNDYAFDGKAILIAGNGNFNVRYYSGKFNAYQRTYVLMPPEEYIGILYMECLRKADSFKKGGNGSIIKFITKNDIDNIYITVPPQDKILQPFNMCLDLMQLLNDESSILTKLRDWLLPMLMNGQVEIKE